MKHECKYDNLNAFPTVINTNNVPFGLGQIDPVNCRFYAHAMRDTQAGAFLFFINFVVWTGLPAFIASIHSNFPNFVPIKTKQRQ